MPNPASTKPPTTSPPDSPLEEPILEATQPGFKSPPPPRQPDPLPEDATIRPPADEDLSDGGENAELDSATSSTSERSATPSPASIDPSFFIEVARSAVGILSLGVGWVRARRHGPGVSSAWIADEDDAKNIGDPLARIASRRVPAVAGDAAPDVVDGIEAVMGTVNYGITHAKREAELITAAAQGVDLTQPEQS